MTLTAAWPAGYALVTFEVLDSTNDEARRMALSGAAAPVWIRADRQESGRGRRGRVWQSPTGNLAATLLLRPEMPAAEAAQLSFVAALACADAVASVVRHATIAVKWPNDILADGRKIAGILLESSGSGSGRIDWLAIGIGINLAHHPSDTEFPAISLAALGEAVPAPNAMLMRLAAQWSTWYEVMRARGFAPIREAWLGRAAGLGSRIRARLQSEEISGVFEGIDETGALLLRQTPASLRTISAGDVFF